MTLINRVKAAYFQLPPWLLRCSSALFYAVPERLRYGKDFHDTSLLLKETEKLSRQELDELINQRFLLTVRNAYENVPFYRSRYDAYGVDMSLIKDIRDITRLPTIDKNDLRQFGESMVSRTEDPAKLLKISSSGTTGEPVSFFQSQSMTMTEWAYVMHLWSRAGVKPDSSRLVLRGKPIHPQSKDPSFFYDPLRRELCCSVFDMREETLEKYCQATELYKPEFIHSYPSAVVRLCQYIENRPSGLNHHFRGVLLVSETLYPHQRSYIERVLNTKVYSFYGHSERAVIAGECEHATSYHVEPLYGYCELLDAHGHPAPSGEIVATGFLNHAMPLIRYKTGDLAAWDTEQSCPCGRNYQRLKTVEGRIGDSLIAADGSRVSTLIGNHSDALNKVTQYQFVQNAPGAVTVEVIPGKDFSPEDRARIRQTLENACQGNIDFRVECVQALPLLPNGKFQMIRSKEHI